MEYLRPRCFKMTLKCIGGLLASAINMPPTTKLADTPYTRAIDIPMMVMLWWRIMAASKRPYHAMQMKS